MSPPGTTGVPPLRSALRPEIVSALEFGEGRILGRGEWKELQGAQATSSSVTLAAA